MWKELKYRQNWVLLAILVLAGAALAEALDLGPAAIVDVAFYIMNSSNFVSDEWNER